jgi:hypothetical protein
MTIYEYMASANPNGAKNVINSFGKKANRRPDILARQLAMCVNEHGKKALYQIALNHPDKELITQCNEEEQKSKPETTPELDLMSNAEGQEIKKLVEDIKDQAKGPNTMILPKNDEKPSEKTELLIIGAIAIVGLALILKK